MGSWPAGGIEARVRLCHRRYPNQTSAKSFVLTTHFLEPRRARLTDGLGETKVPGMSATILHLSNDMLRTGIPSRIAVMFSPPGPRKPAHCHTRPTHNANVTPFASDQIGTVVPTWHSSKCTLCPRTGRRCHHQQGPQASHSSDQSDVPFFVSHHPVTVSLGNRQFTTTALHSAMHSCSIIAVHQVPT